MKRTTAILVVAACFHLVAAMAVSQYPSPATQVAGANAKTADEWNSLKQRYQANGEFVAGGMWWLAHGYRSESQVDAMMKLVEVLFKAIEQDDVSGLKSVGGVDGFNQRVLGLMHPEDDDTVAGFATKVLTISCGIRCAPQIVEVMRKRDKSWTDEDFYPPASSRAQAAMSLAQLGASNYKTDIADLLKSASEYDRSGGSQALAKLKATEYADEIADLLTKRRGHFREASAIHALIELGVGMKYKRQIALVLDDDSGFEMKDTAEYALARLGATEYAAAIAKQLGEKYRRASAAKALAIMGAAQYAPQIAAILNEDNGLDQSAAMLALGILNAREYAPKIATALKRKDYTSNFAATSLLLMGAKDYAQEAADVLSVNQTGHYVDVRDFSELVAADVAEINQRVVHALEQIKKPTTPK